MQGKTLNDRYELTAQAGKGGMGAVYRAYDKVLQRHVAVKILNDTRLDKAGEARLLQEARAAAQLHHPNIITIHDVGQADGVPYLVMQWVEGTTLRSWPKKPLLKTLTIVQQICAALAHAHTHGVIHRDLKPENVIITPAGAAQLMDFGLARSATRLQQQEEGLVGTAAYMAPEQVLGQPIDGRADLYALGVVLYELITGDLPFQEDDPFTLITQNLHGSVVPPREKVPGIPAKLNDLILALLAKHPAERPAGAAAVQGALEEIIGALEAGSETGAAPEAAEQNLSGENAPRLRLYLLGNPRVELDGCTVDIRRRKSLALLAHLAVTNQHHRREKLAALFWPDAEAVRASAYLRRELWDLRQVIGETWLAADPDQIGLAGGQDIWVDVLAFNTLLDQAGKADGASQALVLLENAAALYGGEFLAGFTLSDAPDFDDWQFFLSDGLRQNLAGTLEQLIRGYISTGNYEAPIPHARRWVGLDPLHEPAHQALMRLYYWNGQYAAALRQYQELVRTLDEELGVEPSPESVDLHEAIKNRRLTPPIPPQVPRKAPNETPESTQTPRPDPASVKKPTAQLEIPHNLPLQSTPFIGRETELAALGNLLADPNIRLVTILGPGGMGKTRMAMAAANQQLNPREGFDTHLYQDGIYFVPLAPVDSSDKIVLALAEQLGFMFSGNTKPSSQILNYLEKQHLLLIFDNFEHLITGADFIAAILQGAPNVTVLVTSRERLLIAGESVYRLGGLAFPTDLDAISSSPEEGAAEYGAVAMFLHHARLIRSDLSFDPNTIREVAQICKLVQGMPLAILLASSWVETISLAEIGEAITNNVDILASKQRDLPPRQHSIRAAFETSWTHLSPPEQAVFAKLSVFRGGFTRKAAEVVAGASLFTLRTLIEKSLLTPSSLDQYEVHELLRQYAGEKLADRGEMDKVQEAHARHYLSTLHSLEAGVKGRDQANAFSEIDSNLSNIQRAWEWALAQGQFSLIDDALETLTVFFFFANRVNEGHRMFLTARERLENNKKDEQMLGRLLARHAWLKSEYGLETTSIEKDLERGEEIAEQKGSHREMAQVLLARGYYLSRIHRDHTASLAAFEKAYEITKKLDDQFYMAILLTRIGYCQDISPDTSLEFSRKALELALESGNIYVATGAQNNLANITIMVGDSLSGEQMLLQGLELENKKRLPSKDSNILSYSLALAGFLRGDLDQMKKYLPPSENMIIGKASILTIASTTAAKALLSVVNGDLDLAEQLANRSIPFSSNPDAAFQPNWALAMVHTDRGNFKEARHQLSMAYRIPELTAYPGIMTRSLPVSACLLAKSSQLERAVQVLSLSINHPASQVGWLRHWGKGANLRQELEQALGTTAFQAAWEKGKGLDLVETFLDLGVEFSDEILLSPPPNNLPPQSTPFIGRETELKVLDDLLANPDTRLVTILGPGGMGKTRLALATAERHLNHWSERSAHPTATLPYKDGIYFVPLAPVRFVESLVPAIIEALNLNYPGSANLKAKLLGYLKDKQLLVVLDNFEHLLHANGSELQSCINVVGDILQAAPKVNIVVTSRERLNLRQERLFSIQGLPYPETETSEAAAEEELIRYTAVQLFLDAAKRIHHQFELTSDDLPSLTQILRLVGGMPLGVELAAGWVDTLSLADIAAEIQTSLDFLETDIRDVPERHQSMRAVFDASWEQMNPQEQAVFPRLSIFSGGFTRQAAQEVAGASLRLLNRLSSKSFLSYNRGRNRYEIHELLRQFAWEKLDTVPEASGQIHAAHARYYSELANRLEGDLKGKNQQEATDEIGIELENLHLAWGWGVDHRDIEVLDGCLGSLSWFSQHRGQVGVHQKLLRKALDAFSPPNREITLTEPVQVFLGRLHIHLGFLEHRINVGDSNSMLLNGIEMLRGVSTGVEGEIAYGLNLLALSLYFTDGNYANAMKLAQEARDWAAKVNDLKEIAYAYNVMGHLADFQAEYLEAGPLFEKSIQHYDQINEHVGRAYAVNNWGRAAYAMGDYELARQLIEEALEVRQTFDDPIGQAYSLLDLGKLKKMQGDYKKAETYMQSALEISQEVGDLDLVGRCYNGLGMVAMAEGNHIAAEEFHQKSLKTFQEIAMIRELPMTYNLLAKTASHQGNLSQAKEHVQKGLKANEPIQNRSERASALRHLGHISLAEGNPSIAKSHYQDALRILIETGARPVMLDIIMGWAQILLQENASSNNQEQAAELLVLAARHPASEHETRIQAERLLLKWFPDHNPGDLKKPNGSSETQRLEETVLNLIK